MKRIILYISLLFVLSKENAYCQCNANYEFDNYCRTEIHLNGLDPTSPGATFGDNCAPPWMPSHGSPQIMWINFDASLLYNAVSHPIWNAAYMWAKHYTGGTPSGGGDRGEGILAPFTFIHNQTYRIAVKYKVHLENQAAASDGEFRIIAAQNVHRPSKWKTGNLVPGADRQQRIATIADRNTSNQWVRSTEYSFTADNDYNEFWIYPFTTNTNQYDFYVDWIYVCLDNCAGSHTYNQGVIPTGEPKVGNIFVGSSYGGSGTVTVSSTAQTTLTAATEITFKPEFKAVVSTGTFIAKIESCYPPKTRMYDEEQENDENSVLPVEIPGEIDGDPEYDSSYGQRQSFGSVHTAKDIGAKPSDDLVINKEFRVYPNPANDKVNIDFYSEKALPVRIKLLNSIGASVREIISSTVRGMSHLSLDVGNLSTGTYFIQIIDGNGKATIRKIQKIK